MDQGDSRFTKGTRSIATTGRWLSLALFGIVVIDGIRLMLRGSVLAGLVVVFISLIAAGGIGTRIREAHRQADERHR